ncbi:11741_t:CDS:1 [Ambispora gerdemannii]|uniref:11741_t:CDS:1 n=1 Tax=Ambispora gerdemannii TaxID=144530 RepID=A0A9N9BK25_9GLOM|nr:11741_t:CDS:1 [Ambispora gerdemannii]
MASTLARLCLYEIFKYFYVSEEEKCNSKKLNYNRRQLFHFALVNRHWCNTAIPLLWGRPFPLTSEKASAVFISTLLNCFANNEESRTIFQYNIFIKQLSLESLSIAIFNWSKFKRYYDQKALRKNDPLESLLEKFKAICFNRSKSKRFHNQQESRKNSRSESLFETFKTICHSLIECTANTFFEIEFEATKVTTGNSCNFNYNLFQIPNSKASLEQLRSLKLSFTDSTELLESASKTCPNLSTLEIILPVCSEFSQLLSYFSSFANLKHLRIDCVKDLDDSKEFKSLFSEGDKLIDELGKNLPKRLETLSIEGELKFSANSLKIFLHGSKGIHFKSLEFPHSYISDEHLEIILEAINDSNLDVGIQQIEAPLTINQVKKYKDHGIALKISSFISELNLMQLFLDMNMYYCTSSCIEDT